MRGTLGCVVQYRLSPDQIQHLLHVVNGGDSLAVHRRHGTQLRKRLFNFNLM